MPVIFRCPKCRSPLGGEPPDGPCGACGHAIPREGAILILTDDPVMKEGREGWYGYDKVADGYDRFGTIDDLDPSYIDRRAARLSTLVPDGGRVLDIGCGPGKTGVALARCIAPRAGKVFGGDISMEMLRRFAARAGDLAGESVILCRLNALVLPFEDESFDVVWEDMFIGYVGDPLAALNETRRVLKPDGVFAMPGIRRSEKYERGPQGHADDAYWEALREVGVKAPYEPGHGVPIRERIGELFPRCEEIETPDLIRRYTMTLGWAMDRQAARFTMRQIPIGEEAHARACIRAVELLKRTFGENYRNISAERTEHGQIIVRRP